jgi:23S rRNA (uridine2552-2'-O)-methyltransferase
MKKNRSSKNWIIKQHRDQFYKKSKILGYRSRSAFKLIELNKKFKFLKNQTMLLDVGASPGGWSQVAREIIKRGKIVAIDIKSMDLIEQVDFYKYDFLLEETKAKILNIFGEKIDTIISDMAANTTGNKNLDCIRTNQLCGEVIDFASKILKSKGSLVSKLFMGEDFLEIKNLAKKRFKNVDFFKPEASRDDSKETYIHCSKLKTL